jgi:hypothetical protein
MYALCTTTAGSGVRAAHPFSSPPPLRGGAHNLARYLDHYEIGGWVFEKNRLLQGLKFDKRWLKYTVRMEDCSYLSFLMIKEYV